MRITLVTDSSHDVGSDMSGFAEFLAARSHDVTMLSLAKTPPRRRPSSGIRYVRPGYAPLASTRAIRLLNELACLPNCDVLVLHSDCTVTAVAAALYRRLAAASGCNPRLICMPGRLATANGSSSAVGLVGKAMRRCIHSCTGLTLRQADAVILPGEGMRRLVVARYGSYVCGTKLSVVLPWYDGHTPENSAFSERSLAPRDDGKTLTVVHHGTCGTGHDVAALAQAIDLTSTDGNIIWVLTGNGPRPEQLHRGNGDHAMRNVRYTPPQPGCVPGQPMPFGDVHVVSQTADLADAAAAARLAQIMAAGKPVIAVAPEGADCSRFVREHKAGFAIASGRGEVLARSLWQLRDSATQRNAFGQAARVAFETAMSPRVAYPRLERILIGGETA